MRTSIFALELSQLTIDDIRAFCDQGFSEGLRIEYKERFPRNLKLAEAICAFANTEGGVILLGIKADKEKNQPTAIPGIELRTGLEEKVVNICLSHISPTITPEVKVCDFKSNTDRKKSDRAVVFIRVRSSFTAPHYLLDNNEIRIRVHNRTALADLRTIEALIDRRESAKSTGYQTNVFFHGKKISVDNEPYESVVIGPQFRLEPFVRFYTKENCDWLFEVANEVMRFSEQKPETWQLTFVNSPERELVIVA